MARAKATVPDPNRGTRPSQTLTNPKVATTMVGGQTADPNASNYSQTGNVIPTMSEAGIAGYTNAQDTSAAVRQEQLDNAKSATGLTAAERTAATKQVAGAPIQYQGSGAGGGQGNLGFNSNQIQEGSQGFDVQTAQDRNPNAPLQSPKAGSMGQAGNLGVNPLTHDPTEGLTRGDGTNGQAYESPADFEARKAAILQQEQTRQQIQQDKQVAEQQKVTESMQRAQMTPEVAGPSAGSNAALANLPPEAQFLAPFLQQQQDTFNQAIQENAQLTQGMMGNIQETYGTIEQKYQDMENGLKTTASAIQGLLDEARTQNDKNIALQQQAEQERLAWDEQRIRRDISKQKREQHDGMVAQIALLGGFGQDAGMREVMESDAEYDQKMNDLATQFSFARTDLSAKYSAIYTENQNKYTQGTTDNLKELRSGLERISLQEIGSTQARSTAEQTLLQNAWDTQTTLRTELAKSNVSAAKDIQFIIDKEKDRKLEKEDIALERIDYLLKNYPRESVAEAIRELGRDVTSFDVQALIDNPTISELEKAEAAKAKVRSSSSGGYASALLPSSLQTPVEPEVSVEDFMSSKVSELEKTALQSFSPAKRAELIAENMEQWEKEYKATHLAGIQGESLGQATQSLTQQFGQEVVNAAQLVMDGTYTGTDPVGKAAKALGVPAGQVATALTKLRQTGAVQETSILSPAGQKARDSIIKEIKGDAFYTVWNGAKSAATRIQVAIGDNGGASGISDIMAINAFQNGIVDPGATVREGDVSLMQSAAAWADLVKLDYWKEKIADGDKLPPAMRVKMLQLATATRDAYGRDFQIETVPKIKTLIQQNGLPSTVLDDYLGTGGATMVSPKVSDFLTSKGY